MLTVPGLRLSVLVGIDGWDETPTLQDILIQIFSSFNVHLFITPLKENSMLHRISETLHKKLEFIKDKRITNIITIPFNLIFKFMYTITETILIIV